MTNDYVQVHLENHICWLTLNRPQQRNPLSCEMLSNLHQALDAAGQDAAVRVIVIASTGPVFSAGHDLKQMYPGVNRAPADQRENIKHILDACSAMMLAIINNPKPVIASVQGTATAAGCQLVAVCDLAVAAEAAKFCTPGVNIGAFCTTPLVTIGRNINRKHAMELALTGDMFTAEDAIRMGLINKAVPLERLSSSVRQLALQIAAKSTRGIQAGKAAFYRQLDMPIEQALRFATDEMTKVLTQPDAAEGVAAFFEKRAPEYSDARFAQTGKQNLADTPSGPGRC